MGAEIALIIAVSVLPGDHTRKPGDWQKLQQEQTFSDHLHGCKYVVGGSPDGLVVIIGGADYCIDRIVIRDGRRVLK